MFVCKISKFDAAFLCCGMPRTRHDHKRIVVKRFNLQMLTIDWSDDLDDGEIELPCTEIIINGGRLIDIDVKLNARIPAR